MGRERASLRAPMDQRGEILIETLITLVILIVSVLGLMGSVAMAVMQSGVNEQFVRSGNEVTSVAEVLDAAPYEPCGSREHYNAELDAVYTQVPGYRGEVVVAGVEYLQSATAATPVWLSSPPSPCDDQGLQRITIEVRSERGPEVGSRLVLVKRRNDCPASISPAPGEVC